MPRFDIYYHQNNNGLRWHTTRWAHYISIWHLQINIRRTSTNATSN